MPFDALGPCSSRGWRARRIRRRGGRHAAGADGGHRSPVPGRRLPSLALGKRLPQPVDPADAGRGSGPAHLRVRAHARDARGSAGNQAARNPGYQEAVEILSHDGFYKRIAADPKETGDTRAVLKARLFDSLVGDWDRLRDQWRWARFADRPAWVPIPDDRDQAFSRFEGL